MAPPRPQTFDLAVFGAGYPNWLLRLAPDAAIWAGLPMVRSVALYDDDWRPPEAPPAERLVLPLLERNIRVCPPGWALIPKSAEFEVLADKAQFARYMRANRLERFAPRTFWTVESVQYPAVVKRTDLFAGWGIRIVHTEAELTATLNEDTWSGFPTVLQEYVEGELEYVVQAVLVRGLIMWHAAFEIVIPPDEPIRHPNTGETVRPVSVPARELFVLQSIIAPLDFSGPINFNYRRRPDGSVALFEINPRVGGSLFRPESGPILAAAIDAIAQHATWHAPADGAGTGGV
jgi:hypothetical protein